MKTYGGVEVQLHHSCYQLLASAAFTPMLNGQDVVWTLQYIWTLLNREHFLAGNLTAAVHSADCR
jgi:hypothetical protein